MKTVKLPCGTVSFMGKALEEQTRRYIKYMKTPDHKPLTQEQFMTLQAQIIAPVCMPKEVY